MGQEDRPKSGDDIIRFVIEPREETPQEREIGEVARKTQIEALTRRNQSTSLVDYLRWHQAAIFATPATIAWMWEFGGTTPEGIIEDQESEVRTQIYKTNATAAESMKLQVEALAPMEGMIRVALKRVRDENENYTYRVLATFPESVVVSDLLGETVTDVRHPGQHTFFFEPENACVNHACDDLFREHRGHAFYIPYIPMQEAIGNLQTINNALNEYMLGKADSKKITQDPQNYLLVALLGGYSNERLRTRVSDFWSKTS